MTDKHEIDTTRIQAEPMIDARQAAASLRLPYYWFSDAAMRAKHKIPHYQMGSLVRYRLSELSAWAASSVTTQGRHVDKNDADCRESE